jgi:hypothetical protein
MGNASSDEGDDVAWSHDDHEACAKQHHKRTVHGIQPDSAQHTAYSIQASSMRAILCEALGDARTPLGDGVLRLSSDVPWPALPPGHCRIQVEAASINFPDALQIKVGGRLHSRRSSS